MKHFTIHKSPECQANRVSVDGVEVGSVQWSGCYFYRRGGQEVRSQGYWYILGKEEGVLVPRHKEKFKTMKAAAEALVNELQLGGQ